MNGAGTRAGRHRAAFFDLDKTLIATSGTLAFGLPLYRGGVMSLTGLMRSAGVQLSFTMRPADAARTDRLRSHLSSLCAGRDVARVRAIVAESMSDVITPVVFPDAVALIDAHRAAGRDVVIVSASPEDVVRPIGAMLGVHAVIATGLEVADGRYTGRISRYVYGSEKAEAMRQFARARGYDLDQSYAYSDSPTDLPMLDAVGHPSVVNPNRALRLLAAQRAWPILEWRRGTRHRLHLRRRHDRPRHDRPDHDARRQRTNGARPW